MELICRAGESCDDVMHFVDEWKSDSPYMQAHTSGSTGTPKEIKLLKSDMITSAKMTCEFLNISGGGLMALVLSPGYIAGKMMIVRSMVTDSALWVEKPSNRPLLNYNLTDDIDLLAVVPSQLDYLLSDEVVRKVKNLLIGGSPLSAEMESRLMASGVNGYVTYGMTETCSHVSLRRLGEEFYSAMPGVRFGLDSRGCLTIECPHLSIGSVVTNDVVELRDDTHFRWLGRYDNVINSGGIKLFPEEIETRISRIVGDLSYYLCSRNSKRWGEELVMVVEGSRNLQRLYESLSANLEAIMRPKAIISVGELPRTFSGKIKRLSPESLNNLIDSYEPFK
ncbi:MAG: AMP-binding protein [Bacteroides sp.]|nr:AMP-binding protein [Bacteroides sp.]